MHSKVTHWISSNVERVLITQRPAPLGSRIVYAAVAAQRGR